MDIQLPQKRMAVNPVQTQKRNIPVEQIIAVEGQNPLATAIDTSSSVLGQVLAKKAELKRQGEQLARQRQQVARLEQLSGQQPGSFEGLDPETAFSFAQNKIKQNTDIQEEARKLAQNTTKIRALESQFGYKQNELGEEPSAALLRVQNDLQAKRIASGPAADRVESQEKGRYRQYLLDMEQRDPVIKKINENDLTFNALSGLTDLAKQGNTVAFSGVGIKMAKAMGEVGVMTEQDIKRYVNSRMITQKAADILSDWTRGKPSEATINEIEDISSAMKTAYQDKLQPRYDKFINAYSNIEGLKPEEFAAKLSLPYGGSNLKSIQKPKPTIITPTKVGRFKVEVVK